MIDTEKIQMVMRQTNYNESEAKSALEENNGDVLVVVKKYLGLPIRTTNDLIKGSKNQEIYKQFRQKLHITKELNAQSPKDI